MKTSIEKHIHIVSFDIPYPADYGGVIDVYYKIKELKNAGFQIHLHVFEYGRIRSKELEDICFSVDYYRRKKGIVNFFSILPYIVKTRSSNDLIKRLKKDNFPILFEGIHTSFPLMKKEFQNRLTLLRAHNVEHDYYRFLSNATSNYFKKIYFFIESLKLRRYEIILEKVNAVLSISTSDYIYFNKKYGSAILLNAFHPNNNIQSIRGKGNYLIYHGNLSVEENEKAALFLLQNVFSKISFPAIIAGKNPSKFLIKEVSKISNVQLIINPDQKEMNRLIRDSHINILPTFQSTGIKLKLFDSIALGRFCITNSAMVNGTDFEELVYCVDQPQKMVQLIQKLFGRAFDESDISKRRAVWDLMFSNKSGIKKLTDILQNYQ
jgi:hypothetical protein